ncbi:ATP-dependent endonuclease [Plantibacter sp. MMLR14_011]|uniref:ATP-dependent nuclease n=1 Tax=Plantibacter sp. MMLR14_011 TaxID=1898746 RepID=UPI0009F68F0A|nr:AAA family ATPase [Plantibacter sp. MMLR14_011]
MRIGRINTHNFRNLADLDTELGRTVVIVGENRAGKSNLLHAVRLVLDPSLPYADRRLSNSDFWDGLDSESGDPMRDGQEIRVSIDLDDLGKDTRILAAVGSGLVSTNPPVARLTYKWAPDPKKDGAYSDGVYFRDGSDNARVPADLRDEIFVAFTSALRDAENDLRAWRRSPLRSLLERVMGDVPVDDATRINTLLEEANDAVASIPRVQGLEKNIADRLESSVGARHAVKATLRTVPRQIDEVIKGLLLYLDGAAARPLSTASLGSLNILYFVLLQLGYEARLEGKEVSHTLVLSEEPEAHLHPHLQRSVFGALGIESPLTSVFITTHSPQLVSDVDVRSLLRLSRSADRTIAHRAATAALSDREWDDMNRYLNATKAELVFATKVLLVEGYAEEILIPAIANSTGYELDKEGVTICAVHGTHFLSYARLCAALGIPFAVLTDGDPDENGASAGSSRLDNLAAALGTSGANSANGLFVGEDTLELDLYRTTGNRQVIEAVLLDLGTTNSPARINSWSGSPTRAQLMSEIGHSGGKGRFAQRLAAETLTAPSAVAQALSYLRGV